MGMSPEAWGPAGWHFIHATVLTFPQNPTEEQVRDYKEYFNALSNILPCELCREEFKKKLNEAPPPYDNADHMFRWTVDLHNQVNQENGKPKLSYEQAQKEFVNNSNPKNVKNIFNKTTFTFLLGGVGLGLIVGGVMKRSKGLSIVGSGLVLGSIIMQMKERKLSIIRN